MWAEQLFTAYLRYLARNSLTAEVHDCGPGKWSFVCRDVKARDLFAAEAGGHCIQRVPSNGGGKKHTSYATVVLTILRKVNPVELKECDLEETMQRGRLTAGGQHANKTNSAVRLRHKPTGLEVFINGRDQWTNRQTAREALAGKLEERTKAQQTRATYDGAGRGQKVRTYNLTDSRITDHRNGAKCHRPDAVLKEGRFELLRTC